MNSRPHRDIRPLVLGANGLLGRALADRLGRRFPETVAATAVELDVTDRWRLENEAERLAPTVVINCAAMADVDACERTPELARRVNAEAPAALAAVCRNIGARLVHFSTDYVFDGEKGAEYEESDAPNPINEYGRSKLEGESAVLETLVEVVVMRVSFLFGPGRPTFIDKIAREARSHRDAIPVVDGWITKPTHVEDIAAAVEQILPSDVTGVWHFAGAGPAVSRLEFARRVLALLGEAPERAVPQSVEKLQLPARRPRATPLSTNRFAQRFGPRREWTDWAREHLLAVRAGDP